MFFLTSDESIESTRNLLNDVTSNENEYEYLECTESEGKDALLHRYVAGAAPIRYRI